MLLNRIRLTAHRVKCSSAGSNAHSHFPPFQDSASRYTSFRGAEFRNEVLRGIKSTSCYVQKGVRLTPHTLTPQHTKQLRYSLVVVYVALRLGLPMASQATLLQSNS
jgi:hypothetical protein